jgi:hypothetical protein
MNESIVTTNKNAVQDTKVQVDPTWKGVYKAGGLCLAAAGILYLIGSTLGLYFGGTPGNSQAYLQSLAAHPIIAPVTYWIFSLADILFIPAILGLYLALKGINKNAMLIAAGLLAFFVTLDLGVTESNTLALVALAQSIAAATSDATRAAYQAAANWGLATLPIATFFSWIGPSVGFLITSIVMRKGVFGQPTARLGMIVFGLAIVASFYFLYPVPVLGLALTPILILYGVWLIAAGRRLFELGLARRGHRH